MVSTSISPLWIQCWFSSIHIQIIKVLCHDLAVFAEAGGHNMKYLEVSCLQRGELGEKTDLLNGEQMKENKRQTHYFLFFLSFFLLIIIHVLIHTFSEVTEINLTLKFRIFTVYNRGIRARAYFSTNDTDKCCNC